jgi:ABC-type antimicrobial peptide transport system permease subunit
VSVLLIGYGIYFGITKYLTDVQQRDIRANRLIVEIKTGVSTVESITDDVLAELREDLGKINIQKKNLFGFPTKQELPAVQGVYPFTEVQLEIYKRDFSSFIPTIGVTVDADSPLLDRMTLNGEKIEERLLLSNSTEGIILKKSWLKRLDYDEDNPPENIIISYSGKKEELPILSLVDKLPDRMFLISSESWHNIRDRTWRPNYKIGVLNFSKGIDINSLIPDLELALEGFIKFGDQKSMKIIPDTSSRTENKLLLISGLNQGYNKRFWNKVIYEKRLEPFLQENGITAVDFNMTSPMKDAPLPGSLEYLYAAVYFTEFGAVTKIAKAIRDNSAKLGVDPYVENLYKMLHQIDQLLRLIFVSIAFCVFVLCLANIFLTFYQTVLRKRHEIGILKAFGSTKKRISSIFFIESLYLWLFGSLLGLVLGIYGGQFSSNALKNIYDELELSEGELFYLDWNVLFIFISVFIVCEVITFTATYSHAKKTASELLRQRG